MSGFACPTDSPEQAAARAWLAEPGTERRIKEAVTVAHDRGLRRISAAHLSHQAKERAADALSGRLLRRMQAVMRQAARLHVDAGEETAEAFLSAVEQFQETWS